jgi:hypothetical protein
MRMAETNDSSSDPASSDPAAIRRTGKTGSRFLIGFGAIFALAGAACVAAMLGGHAEGGSGEPWVGAVVGGVFVLAGGGIVALGIYAGRESSRQALLVEQHPDAPWMWKPEWAAGRIEGAGRAGVVAMWIFAAIWNGISWPIAPKLVEEFERGEQMALLFGLFPVLGVVLVGLAIRTTLQQRRFGTPMLLLETIPGVVGGYLRGAVQTRAPLQGARRIDLTLTCVRRRTTGSGKNRSTSESILFQEKGDVAPSTIRPGPWGSEIRVDFRIPFDSSPTDLARPDDTTEWRVEIAIDLPGVDFQARFDVPVFRTEQSSEAIVSASDAIPQISLSGLDDRAALPGSKVQAKALAQGGVELYFPAARNPGAALGLTVMCALWMSFVAGMLHFGTPILFPIVFGGFGLLILAGVLQMWAGTTRVRASARGLEVKRALLGIGRLRLRPANEIEALSAEIGMTVGRTPFYRLQARVRGGRFVTCGSGLQDKREAEAYAQLLAKSLGLKS